MVLGVLAGWITITGRWPIVGLALLYPWDVEIVGTRTEGAQALAQSKQSMPLSPVPEAPPPSAPWWQKVIYGINLGGTAEVGP